MWPYGILRKDKEAGTRSRCPSNGDFDICRSDSSIAAITLVVMHEFGLLNIYFVFDTILGRYR